jgi:signal transduction histidine kinase
MTNRKIVWRLVLTDRSEQNETIRLGSFIRSNSGPIIDEWLSFARTREPASNSMTDDALRDHIAEILGFVADDLESPQTSSQQAEKAQGEGPIEETASGSPAQIHAGLRLLDGFDLDQMIAEYRALRASVTKLWRRARNTEMGPRDLDDLIRFNEAIDQAITESVAHYTVLLKKSRALFLGILAHDLRNPIGAAQMSATWILQKGGLTDEQSRALSQIVACSSRANIIMTDLIDLTRLQIGSKIPIAKESMDMAELSRALVAEIGAFYPDQVINLEVSGDPNGKWDKSRMGQVLSNLLGNAIAHGLPHAPVTVAVGGGPDEVTLSVHNQGKPIPESEMPNIFESLVQGNDQDPASAGAHLGLGLYITKKIIAEHHGTIAVTSSEQDGTTFIARLPRH